MTDKQQDLASPPAHTPGPWCISGDDEVPEGIPVIEIIRDVPTGPDAKQIAYVQPSSDPPMHATFYLGDEDRANARLIASAPDLLEALERLATQMQNVLLVADIPQRFAASFNEGQAQAEAAIAKARGQS